MLFRSPRLGHTFGLLALVGALLVLGSPALPAETAPSRPSTAAADVDGFTDQFFLQDCTFSSRGRNPYFILEPGYRLVLRGQDAGETVELTITMLNQTKPVTGVQTRVVEERETRNGKLVEVSRNFFALCNQTNSVIYFGEEVDIYQNGQIVSHAGAWLAGQNGARAGVIMPGTVLLGARYFQEVAPNVALDRSEIESLSETVVTPAGQFTNVLKTEETTPLEPKAIEVKYHARGIGLIQDGVLKLVSYGFN